MTDGPNPKLPILLCAACLVIIITLTLLYGDRQSPLQLTRERLQVLERKVTEYAREHGVLPESLTDLELPEDALIDHLGEPFHYQVQSGSATVTSFGSDKKPGGMLFKRDHVVEILFP